MKILFIMAFVISSFEAGIARAGDHQAPAGHHASETHQASKSHHVTTTSPHDEVQKGVAPEVALRWLRNGNTRFRKGLLRNDGQSQADVKRLTGGQKPHSIILSCSDSRVPPEVVFDQKLGEIFVVRTAGETLDPTSIASIEYAVEHLGVRNLVVMGHTQCGAVTAALATFDGKDAGSPNLNKLVADMHPRLEAFKRKPASQDKAPESWANVKGVMKDLIKRSSVLEEKVRSGDLKISGSLYHLDSGDVEF